MSYVQFYMYLPRRTHSRCNLSCGYASGGDADPVDPTKAARLEDVRSVDPVVALQHTCTVRQRDILFPVSFS